MILEKEKWRFGKRFAYTVTYDEGFVDLLQNTLPIHQRFGFPGHVAMVVGQIGQPRNVPGSSWNGKFHMDVRQIKELLGMGWGVSCHSMTHGARRSMYTDTYREVVESRERLEDLLGTPVTSFVVPYDNENYPPVLELARQAGYLSVYTLTDALNDYDTDLFAVRRTPLVEEGFYPFFTRLDHYSRLHEAREYGGWVVDYTHLSNPVVISPQKEISLESLMRRFEKIREVGGDDVWVGNGDDVVDYMLVNKGTTVRPTENSSSSGSWQLSVEIPAQVQKRQLTFSLAMPASQAAKEPVIRTEPGRPLTHGEMKGHKYLFSLDVADGLRIFASFFEGSSPRAEA